MAARDDGLCGGGGLTEGFGAAVAAFGGAGLVAPRPNDALALAASFEGSALVVFTRKKTPSTRKSVPPRMGSHVGVRGSSAPSSRAGSGSKSACA